MSIKHLFHIPDGEKVTDAAFSRVLISSVCGILLCMGCLVGTTWAWFIANTENTDNVIEIATVTADVTVQQNDVAITPADDGSYTLPAGDYTMHVQMTHNATAYTRPVFLLMTVTQNGTETPYVMAFVNGLTESDVTVTVENAEATIRFETRWTLPTAVQVGDTMVLTGEAVSAPTTTTTTTTEAETTTTVESTTTTTIVTESTTTTESEPTTTTVATEE